MNGGKKFKFNLALEKWLTWYVGSTRSHVLLMSRIGHSGSARGPTCLPYFLIEKVGLLLCHVTPTLIACIVKSTRWRNETTLDIIYEAVIQVF